MTDLRNSRSAIETVTQSTSAVRDSRSAVEVVTRSPSQVRLYRGAVEVIWSATIPGRVDNFAGFPTGSDPFG